jgi:RNA polymerase sigma factor (sigma-70 family)
MARPVALPAPRASGASIRPGRLRSGVSDERLAKLVARDSEAPFAEIYRRYHQPLYGYCRSIVRDENDAQDALQSAMTAAYAALRKGERDVALRPWLFRIAHNESISLLRKRRPQEISADEQALAAPSNTGEPQQALEQRERLATLVADLETLSVRQRGALLMRELSGLSIEEIAAALGASPSAAKQALFEARTALRDQEEGRSMECDQITKLLCEEDRRLLRGRRVRSHLRACSACREVQATLSARSADLRLLAPPLPALVASAMLARLIGHTAGPIAATAGAASGGASLAGGTGGAAGPAPGAASGGASAASATGGVAGPATGAATAGGASGAGGAAGAGATSGVAGLAAHLGGAAAVKVAASAAIVAAAAAGTANVVLSGHTHRTPLRAQHRGGAAAIHGSSRAIVSPTGGAAAIGGPASSAEHSRGASAAHSGGGSAGGVNPPGALPSQAAEAQATSQPAPVGHARGWSGREFAPGQSQGAGAVNRPALAPHEAEPQGPARGHWQGNEPGLARGDSQAGEPGLARGHSHAEHAAGVQARGGSSAAGGSRREVRHSTPTAGATGESVGRYGGAAHSRATRPASEGRYTRGSSSSSRGRTTERSGHGSASHAQTTPIGPQTSTGTGHTAEKNGTAGVDAGRAHEEHSAPGQARRQNEAAVTGPTGPQSATAPETSPAEPAKGQGKPH